LQFGTFMNHRLPRRGLEFPVLVGIALCVAALGGCSPTSSQGGAVVDASSKTGQGGADGGGAGGAGGVDQPRADQSDPCGPNVGGNSVPLVDGSAPSCPRCSPYSQQHWNPTCSEKGLICEYLHPTGLGAYCRCEADPQDAGAANDAGVPLRFVCGL
jgi:hypothetical protein